MNIAVIGSGYVGLVTGACFAETGATVCCVDVDEKKIKNLNDGNIPIWEPGLEELVKRNIEKKRLSFVTSLREGIQKAEAIFIAVGTPSDEDGSADLRHVLAVAKEIGEHLDHYAVVVTKSTVPVGTSLKVKQVIQDKLIKRNKNIVFDVASNPEFLKEGSAVDDFLKPDRIIIGTDSVKATQTLERLYKPFLLNGHPIVFMDITSSELTKYAANAMLATRISFMNDIANLCELVGADVNMIRKGIGSDPRIGSKFIYPGAGYGGSCFPKDVKAIIKTAADNGYSLEVLKAVERVNNRQKLVVFQKLERHFNGQLKEKKIAIWGLSFKPNTDDMREAPSLAVIEKLLEAGAKPIAYDPVAATEAKKYYNEGLVHYTNNPYSALDGADALILMTEWNEFRILNIEEMKRRMKEPVVIDGRNIYDASELISNGFSYYCIG